MKHLKKVSVARAAVVGDVADCGKAFLNAIEDAFKALLDCVMPNQETS